MKLKEYMKVRGFTLREMGNYFGFPYSTVRNFVEMAREPRISDAIKIVEKSGGAVRFEDLVKCGKGE